MRFKFAGLAALSLMLAATSVGLAQQGQYGPAYGMGPGTMGGYHYGNGMMGGFGYGPGMIGGNSGAMMGGPAGGGYGPGMMGAGGMIWGLSRYPDGYLAFFKTELKITPAQEAAWSKLADVLRAQATARASAAPRGWVRGQPGPGGPGAAQGGTTSWQPPALPDALDQRVSGLEREIVSVKAIRDAVKPLYDELSSDQKATADRLLGPAMFGF